MSQTQAALAATACQLCREQKVRCSHQLPECARCSKLALQCVYPEPPDRRLIAARRAQPRKRPHQVWETRETPESQTSRDNKRPRSESAVVENARAASSSSSSGQTHSDPTAGASSSMPQPSVEAARLLQSAYFTCAFNSSLTFHYPSFQHDEANGRVPVHTVLAIQALGANFLIPLSTQGKKHHEVLRHLGDLRAASESWALAAGKLALQEADEPTLCMVQTCQVLSLFWFSRGDSRRNTMFSGIGYRAIRAMVVESLEELKSPAKGDSRNQEPHLLGHHRAECLRRLFWASWTTNVINSDHYIPGCSADTVVLTLPLPASEVAFLQQKQEPLVTMAQSFSQSEAVPARSSQEPSVFAEVMKCLMLWARVRDHINIRRTFPDKEKWPSAFTLQKDISTWAAQLHPDMQYSKRNLYHQLIVKQQQNYIMLHALHHQCLLVLNSSLVPHFSGISLPQDMPVEVVRVSAAVVMRSVRALANLGAHLVALEWEPTLIAPFAGYCMYAAASVQISALPRGSGAGSVAWENLSNCMKLLKLMKPYWAVLNRLWARFLPLYDTQMAAMQRAPAVHNDHHGDGIEDEEEEEEFLTSPKNTTSPDQGGEDTSVLHYSLRTLHEQAPARTPNQSPGTLEEVDGVGSLSKDTRQSPDKAPTSDECMQQQQQQQQQHVDKTGTITGSVANNFTQPSSYQAPLFTQREETRVDPGSFDPLNIAFQGSLDPFGGLTMDGLEETDWFQLDMEGSLQARQAFNHYF